MSELKRTIISLIEPDFKNSIRLEPLKTGDLSNSEESTKNISGQSGEDIKRRTSTDNIGLMMPWISINTVVLFDDELLGFELDLSNRIPTVFVKFKDTKNRLSVDGPLDAAFICVYMKAPDWEAQRPIRIDFKITQLDGNPRNKTYTVNGIMKLPQFFEEVCMSFPSATSFEHLKKLCQDIGIGYASNEDSTDDTMVRFIPFENFEYFVNNTVSTAYKDEKSFFDWYIDPWYNLCFVNVNKQFDLEDKFEEVSLTVWPPISNANFADGIKDTADKKVKFALSNVSPYTSTNFGIQSYSWNNNSGDVVIKNGYKRTGYWLNIDGNEIESQNAFSEALTTEGAEKDYVLLKGIKREDGTAYDYRKKNKHTWLGKQAIATNQGNVHPNFSFAKVLNHQNLEELEKTTLTLKLNGPNFAIYKYQRVPIAIYENGDYQTKSSLALRDKTLGEENPNMKPDQEGSAQNIGPDSTAGVDDFGSNILNNFLSGYYVVGGIKYVWSRSVGGVQPELKLIRREWPIPFKNSF